MSGLKKNLEHIVSYDSLLERDYYAATASIKPSSGERLGLSPVSNTRYVHRPGVVGVAETPLNEI